MLRDKEREDEDKVARIGGRINFQFHVGGGGKD